MGRRPTPILAIFRHGYSGTTWTASDLAETEPGVYLASAPSPTTGSTAFMIEMTYDVDGAPMTFTTEVQHPPRTHPPRPSPATSTATA